jgi:hypothetical protein
MFQGMSQRILGSAEDRNKHTAKLYDDLGLAEYEAIEALNVLIIKNILNNITMKYLF